MTRKSKVGAWCGFHRTSSPLLALVPSWRHHYCQVIQLLHAFVSIFMHCSTGWGLVVPWFAWLTASIAAVIGSCPNAAGLWQSHPCFTTWLRGRHIVGCFIDFNYKVKCMSTRSCTQHSAFTVSGTKAMIPGVLSWLINRNTNQSCNAKGDYQKWERQVQGLLRCSSLCCVINSLNLKIFN